jgi:pyrroline-5-carboxylate reductase
MLPIGFIGAGNMAEAIVRAMIAKEVALPSQVYAADPMEPRRNLFATLGANSSSDNRNVASHSKTLLLCCKPQQMQDVLEDIAPVLRSDVLLVSIAAGITIDFITRTVLEAGGESVTTPRVVRVMPNTPLMSGYGMTAVAPGESATVEDVVAVRSIFEVGGKVVEIRESLMDAVTAVSGSGPAYYFLLTEHLAKAAIELGIDPANAQVLARQTAMGAAVMLAQSADSPQDLRKRVTSPGGTTQAAVEHLEAHHFGDIFRKAVAAAEKRGRELREGKK